MVTRILLFLAFFAYNNCIAQSDTLINDIQINFIQRDTSDVYYKSYLKYKSLVESGKEIKRIYPTVYPPQLNSLDYSFLSIYYKSKINERIKIDTLNWFSKELQINNIFLSLLALEDLSAIHNKKFEDYPIFAMTFIGYELRDTTKYLEYINQFNQQEYFSFNKERTIDQFDLYKDFLSPLTKDFERR
ncbi:hypothetical protein Fleli_2239 [Bernardetia litoralis DSM 6794]|uniref:Uncharacterized protein n=1 Tax=Bernardetia litoralis (strain ATCC 23117 / DSM 6794 / NBRC 15988 / NCIMB 1366 / Fx l1 / Sio-4) TaxID=880071 RepID=I4AKY1_BERLS|nr:hypothetical protein [Bernardetia litoralis]AFM04616.1 hypothetical protein Fleli_2239 [Bernardetia litoralis DSM 6794]